jgi:Mn-dependent DtxR family transcriptional regulator
MLLLTLERIDGDTIVMTHEVMASLLGVRREGVTMAAQKLMHEGIIRYARGRITVLDRARLAQRACECYGVIHQEYERLLPQSPHCRH